MSKILRKIRCSIFGCETPAPVIAPQPIRTPATNLTITLRT